MGGSDRRENPRLAAKFNRPDSHECLKVKRGITVTMNKAALYLLQKVGLTPSAGTQVIQLVKDGSPTCTLNFFIFLGRKRLVVWAGISGLTAIRREEFAESLLPKV